ncbi:MAG: hypothetical protein Q9157_007600 [Trypethelium eluteriae]
MFGRISFCVFLLYLLGPAKKTLKIVLWINIVQQLAINIVMLIQIYAQCGTQIAALWDQEVAAHAKCQSPNVETDLAFAQSALNSVCDLVLAILPPFLLWDLQMPKATKYGLLAVMMLSVFGFAASLVKLVEIKNLGSRGDFTWNMVNLQLWVCVENNIVLMYASIPVLRPLVVQKKSVHGEKEKVVIVDQGGSDSNMAAASRLYQTEQARNTFFSPQEMMRSQGLQSYTLLLLPLVRTKES